MSEVFQPGQHPDAEQLGAFAEQALPAHEREVMLAHMAVCAHCRDIVVLAMPPIEETPAPQLVSPRRPWFYGWGLVWPMAAAMAALVLVAVHLSKTGISAPGKVPSIVAEVKPPATPQMLPTPLPKTPPTMPGAASPPPKTPANSTALPPRAAVAASVSVQRAPPPRAADTGTALDARGVSNIPMNGRNVTDLTTIPNQQTQPVSGPMAQNVNRPQDTAAGAAQTEDAAAQDALANNTGAAIAGAMTPRPAPPLPPPLAPPPPRIATGSVVQFAPATPVTNAASTPIVAASAAKPSNFPGRLPISATGTVANHILALDASGALFVSDNGGRQWRSVSSPWQGRVARLQVIAFPLPSAARGRASAAGGAAAGGHAAPATAPEARSVSSNQTAIADSGIAMPSNASVSGIITDPSGAVIPGASIIVTVTRTGKPYTTTTDRNGRFTIAGLNAGSYQFSVKSPGFAPRQQSLMLAAGAEAQVNTTLTPSAANSEVSVAAELAPLLHTEDSTLGDVIANTQVSAAQPALPRQPVPVFEITTETGDHWTSADGQRWEKK